MNERHIWVLIVFSLRHQIYIEQTYDPDRARLGEGAGGHALTRPGVRLGCLAAEESLSGEPGNSYE